MQSSPRPKIAALERLKEIIIENIEGTRSRSFSAILDEFLQDTTHFRHIPSKQNVPIETVLSQNRNIFFGGFKNSSITREFIEDLRNQYGHKTMGQL